MPKVEDGEKVNRSGKGEVRKEERGGGVGDDASKGTEVLSRLKSRTESAFQPSILPCFHHHPLSARTRWNPRAFERLANTPHREKASVAVRTGGVCICVCTYVRMYVYNYIGAVKTPR